MKEFTFSASDPAAGRFGWILEPDVPPVAIVQIVHGLGCHSGRYRYMAEKLCRAGFLVCADDHAGHGRTAAADGSFGDPGDGGYETFLRDEHLLREYVAGQYPGLPFVMFGHSMGSMIARLYAARYPQDQLEALALCGICQQNPGAEVLLTCPDMEEKLLAGKGKDMQEGLRYFSLLMEKANLRFPGESALAWLCRDVGVQQDYAADPLNNQVGNTLQMVYDFTQLYRLSTDVECARQIPVSLPLLLLAGDQDPCGNYGEGLYHAANQLVTTGHRVTTYAYTGYRHEIHNHPAIRDDVIGKLVEFFRAALNADK